MGTYNTAKLFDLCPRCEKAVENEVNIYLGDTSNMSEVTLGELYPFRPRKQPQNGGLVEGWQEEAGYCECSHCKRDFHCDVFIQKGLLVKIRPNLAAPPYIPSHRQKPSLPCPDCGSGETELHNYHPMIIGRFICCAKSGCSERVLNSDNERLYYVGDRLKIER